MPFPPTVFSLSLARDDYPARSARDRSLSTFSSESDRPPSPLISQNDINTAVRNLLSWCPPGNAPFRAATSSRQATSLSRDHNAQHSTNSFPPVPTSTLPHGTPRGLVAMPAAKSRRAPRFTGQDDEIFLEFLQEYEDLADRNGLTGKQKVETIIRYVPRSLRNLWVTLPGYRAAKWRRFRTELEGLYPDIAGQTRCTRQDLAEFVELSARSLIHDENDVMRYYRNFLTIALPLVDDRKITSYDFNAEFFRGFHIDDQDILADQVFRINPRHPVNEPFDVHDVVDVARRYFAADRFYKPLQLRLRNELRGRSKTRRGEAEKFIRRLFGDSDSDSDQDRDSTSDTLKRPAYETCNVPFKESISAKAQHKEEDDPITLVTQLNSLSVCEPSYLILYSKCQKRFPSIAQHLPKPDLFGNQLSPTAAAVPAPTRQLCEQQTLAPPTPSTADATADAFFRDRNGVQSRGCAFCGMLGHRIRGCPVAQEYVNAGRVKIVGNRLHLPTGQPIPNDGRGVGLKTSVDSWLAANAQLSNEAISTAQRDSPPHITSYGFKIISESTSPVGAYISDLGADNDAYTSGLYDMYDVSATKKDSSQGSAAAAAAAPSHPSLPTPPLQQSRCQ